jgi:hypothetical protein
MIVQRHRSRLPHTSPVASVDQRPSSGPTLNSIPAVRLRWNLAPYAIAKSASTASVYAGSLAGSPSPSIMRKPIFGTSTTCG